METKINYSCSLCGYDGRLWREYNVCADVNRLLCAKCAEDITPGAIMSYKTGYSDQFCQVKGYGDMVPAILTPCETTYWGYTSAREPQIRDWLRKPCSVRGIPEISFLNRMERPERYGDLEYKQDLIERLKKEIEWMKGL